MKTYYVVGGEYTDTQFKDIVASNQQEHGPFHSYKEAQDCWQAISMQNIDNALVRFQIKTVEQPEKYWVVGGIYTSTRFEQLDPELPVIELGPFNSWDEAEKHWRTQSMKYIDDALARFRIEMR